MSNFSPSNLVKGQAKFNQRVLAKGEWRMPDSNALQVARLGDMANPALAALRTIETRAVEASFPIRQAAVGNTSRLHNHSGARGDSLTEAIAWNTFSEPFSISIKQGDNNIFSFDEMWASSMRNATLNLLNRLDAAFMAALVADKTAVNAGGGKGTFNATPDVYEITSAEHDYFYQNAKATMEYNLYKGSIIGIVDDVAKVNAQKLMANGAGNANNTAFQFAGMDILSTTRTVLGSGYDGSGMFFEPGLVSFIPWIPVQNRKTLDPNKILQYNGDYGQIEIEGLGAPIAIHAYAERADGTAANGYSQDLVIQVELSIDMGYVSAPLSTIRGAGDSPVYAVGQLS